MLVSILALLAVSQGWVGAPPPRPPPAVATPGRQLTDARILGSLGACDADQIEVSKLASTKGSTKEVRDYASMMVQAHQQSLQRNTVLAKQLHLNRLLPTDSVMARAHKEEMTQLNLQTGPAFDKVFVQYMVTDHETMIKNINTTLLPDALRPQVKALIRQTLPILTLHQDMGRAWLDKQK